MKPKSVLSVLFAILTLCLLSYSSAAQTPPPKAAEAAMNNGLQALKNSNWKQATEAFDLVLMIAPNYAPAHIGKLCSELTLTEEKQLGDIALTIDEHPFFKSALEHADAAYKEQIQGYAEAIKNRLKEMEKNVDKDSRKPGERMTITINEVEYAFRWCPAGTFTMGSPEDEPNRKNNEILHRVTLTKGFWMLETEVTQVMWASVMGNNPSMFKGLKLPAEKVSWNNCQEYVTKLNELNIAPAGFKFALPTESQWEYACRAGTKTAYSFDTTLTNTQANVRNDKDKNDKTKEVGHYPANAWGLYDMHGNVWEWCQDRFGDYPNEAVVDPIGASSGNRVIRGGGWRDNAQSCRSASRGYYSPGSREDSVGLRVSLIPSE